MEKIFVYGFSLFIRYIKYDPMWKVGFPCSSVVNDSPANARDAGLIPGLGRSLGEGNGNPLQYPLLENPMDKGAWWATLQGVTKGQAWFSN